MPEREREWPEAGSDPMGAPLDWPAACPSHRLQFEGVPNLRVVAEGCLYVSGQPTLDAYRNLRAAGMKSILNLRGEEDLAHKPRAWDPENGLFWLPILPREPPEWEQAGRFLRLLADPDGWPALVHDRNGEGRAATLVALARYAIDGWPVERCLKEARRYPRAWWRRLLHLGARVHGGQEQFLRRWERSSPPRAWRPPAARSWEGIRFARLAAHAKEMEALWQRLPARVRASAIVVHERAMEGWERQRCAGYYDEGEVHVRADIWAASTFLHEIGHNAWQEVLTAEQRGDWRRFWTRNLAAMPRDYARTNPEEGFCECFALAYLETTPRGYRALSPEIQTRIRRCFAAG